MSSKDTWLEDIAQVILRNYADEVPGLTHAIALEMARRETVYTVGLARRYVKEAEQS